MVIVRNMYAELHTSFTKGFTMINAPRNGILKNYHMMKMMMTWSLKRILLLLLNKVSTELVHIEIHVHVQCHIPQLEYE